MHIIGTHHVAVICSDYERSKRFYVEVLVLQGAAGTAFALVLWLWTVPVGWIDRWYGRWAREAAPSSRNFAAR